MVRLDQLKNGRRVGQLAGFQRLTTVAGHMASQDRQLVAAEHSFRPNIPRDWARAASEDRLAAQVIRDALPALGLEAWHDESALTGELAGPHLPGDRGCARLRNRIGTKKGRQLAFCPRTFKAEKD